MATAKEVEAKQPQHEEMEQLEQQQQQMLLNSSLQHSPHLPAQHNAYLNHHQHLPMNQEDDYATTPYYADQDLNNHHNQYPPPRHHISENSYSLLNHQHRAKANKDQEICNFHRPCSVEEGNVAVLHVKNKQENTSCASSSCTTTSPTQQLTESINSNWSSSQNSKSNHDYSENEVFSDHVSTPNPNDSILELPPFNSSSVINNRYFTPIMPSNHASHSSSSHFRFRRSPRINIDNSNRKSKESQSTKNLSAAGYPFKGDIQHLEKFLQHQHQSSCSTPIAEHIIASSSSKHIAQPVSPTHERPRVFSPPINSPEPLQEPRRHRLYRSVPSLDINSHLSATGNLNRIGSPLFITKDLRGLSLSGSSQALSPKIDRQLVKQVIQDVIQMQLTRLTQFTYNPRVCSRFAQLTSQEIVDKLKALQLGSRYVALVSVGSNMTAKSYDSKIERRRRRMANLNTTHRQFSSVNKFDGIEEEDDETQNNLLRKQQENDEKEANRRNSLDAASFDAGTNSGSSSSGIDVTNNTEELNQSEIMEVASGCAWQRNDEFFPVRISNAAYFLLANVYIIG